MSDDKFTALFCSMHSFLCLAWMHKGIGKIVHLIEYSLVAYVRNESKECH